ncbi:MAG: hypothetical protein HC819_17060 [Cyclobacteriaceae bacterium]|nr:hypothetical protein [Cyclobacteriaceae bacterium]
MREKQAIEDGQRADDEKYRFAQWLSILPNKLNGGVDLLTEVPLFVKIIFCA